MSPAAEKLCRELIAAKGNPPVVGGVALSRVIGSGGMGVVYQGTHLRLRIPVAIKFLVLDREDAYSVARFIDEAALAAKVNSPNVVRVYDVNKEGPFEYIVQEYVSGQTSDQKLRDALYSQQRLTEDFVLELAADTARGLAAIHAQEYLHLDIKPMNIMVARKDGMCKILDFGLAQPFNKALRPGTTPGKDGANIDGGTPGYASPEQLQMLHAGPSSDIYSLGISILELLAGKRIFAVDTWEQAQNTQCTTQAPNIQTLRAEISTATAELIDRCVRLDPNQRYSSAMELLADIAKVKQQRLTSQGEPAPESRTRITQIRPKDRPPHVICVDDNAQICVLMSELLTEAGFRAETFTEGARALAKMRTEPPDVVFLDMDMPGMSGLEVCGSIRATASLKTIPVVFITGETAPDSMRLAMQQGATDYLFKPVQADDLITRVHCLTQLSRAQQELAQLENQFSRFRNRLSVLSGKEIV